MNTEALTAALVEECERQAENCNYTAVSFIIWLRLLRRRRTALMVAPVVCGAVATWSIVAQNAPVVGAIFALLATALPPAYLAAGLDRQITDFEMGAGEFTNLRDRFRQLSKVSSLKPFVAFEAEAKPVFERMEKARERALAPPQWAFERAQREIKAGHYEHDYDQRGD